MRRNFQQVDTPRVRRTLGDSVSVNYESELPRRSRRARGPIGKVDSLLCRFCGEDKALLCILRFATVPLAFGLMVLFGMIGYSIIF